MTFQAESRKQSTRGLFNSISTLSYDMVPNGAAGKHESNPTVTLRAMYRRKVYCAVGTRSCCCYSAHCSTTVPLLVLSATSVDVCLCTMLRHRVFLCVLLAVCITSVCCHVAHKTARRSKKATACAFAERNSLRFIYLRKTFSRFGPKRSDRNVSIRERILGTVLTRGGETEPLTSRTHHNRVTPPKNTTLPAFPL